MATAFAIFCADDGSLTFYKRDTVPSVGDEFEGKVVGAVYTGFESGSYSSDKNVPWYNERASILSASFVDEIAPTYTNRWFYSMSNMTSFNATNLNTSNTYGIDHMFNGCSGLTTLDLSSFDTSKVTSMWGTFFGCSGLTTLDLSSFDTSKVTSMRNMFYECSGLTTLDLSSFDTSKVTNMNSMFLKCRGLITLDLSNFNTSEVTDMYTIFYECSGLNTLDLSNFDTSKVTDMYQMFCRCTNLTTIYVSDIWSTAAVTNSTNMFNGCTSLVGAISYDRTVTNATHANYQTGYLTYKFYADYLKNRFVIDGAELSDIGNKIRTLTGGKEGMTPSAMKTGLDNVSSDVDAQADLIAQIQESLDNKTIKALVEGTITKIKLYDIATLSSYNLYYCQKLKIVDLPSATTLKSYSLAYCSQLKTLILRNVEQICTLKETNVFSATPIASGTGYIYVPSALIEDYKVATNWSNYAAQFKAIEDYPDICEEV